MNQPCKYCRNETEEEIVSDTDNQAGVYKSGDKWRMFWEDDIKGTMEEILTFNHCPMCGRDIHKNPIGDWWKEIDIERRGFDLDKRGLDMNGFMKENEIKMKENEIKMKELKEETDK